MKTLKRKIQIKSISLRLLFLLSLSLFLSLFPSCETTETPTNQIVLIKKSVSAKEVWLELKVIGYSLPQKVELMRNGTTIDNFTLTIRDTIIYDKNLNPSSRYGYAAKLSARLFAAGATQIKTLDTTSHNFAWETFYFGDGNATSRFMDVKIINENNIWVVGNISGIGYDSAGAQYDIFNAVRWDGEKWNMERIDSYVFRSQEHKTPYLIKSIYIDNQDTIWVTSSNQIINLTKDESYCHPESTILNAIDGFNNGGIITVNHSDEGSNLNYFNNGEWSRITKPEEGVNLDLLPIVDKNNETIILFPNSNTQTISSRIYSVNNSKMVSFYSELPNVFIASIWTLNEYPIYAVGKGLHENKKGEWNNIDYSSAHPLQKIRGSELNNIIAVGWESVVHYNGSTWKRYEELNGIYNSLAIKDDLVVIVGRQYNKAVIVVGRR